MRLKLAGSCLFGVFFLFVSSGSANIQHSAEVPLRPIADRKGAREKLAALPGAAESFFLHLGAPETRDGDARDTIDAPKDTRTPTSLERARLALAESSAPALSHTELCSSLVDVAQANALPLGFFTNLIWQESRFDHEAISPVGAMGIAQFMPDTAEGVGLDDAFNGREALPASAKLLRTLIDRFGNLGLAAAAYNAGPKRVSDWLAQRSGLPKETRDYVSVDHRQAGGGMARREGEGGRVHRAARGAVPSHRALLGDRAVGAHGAAPARRRGTRARDRESQ